MPRALVVYYSRTGTTKTVAMQLTSLLHADVEEIHERHVRTGAFGWLRAGFEATIGKPARIERSHHNPSLYDIVIVGGPTWNGCVSTPVRAYLHRHLGFAKRVAFFCTFDARGGEGVMRQMIDESVGEPVATLLLRRADVESGAARPVVEDFATRSIAMTSTSPPSSPPVPRLAPSLASRS